MQPGRQGTASTLSCIAFPPRREDQWKEGFRECREVRIALRVCSRHGMSSGYPSANSLATDAATFVEIRPNLYRCTHTWAVAPLVAIPCCVFLVRLYTA